MGRYNFPDILGAVNGSHIPVQAPILNPKCYFDRKKFHYVVHQGVCLYDLTLLMWMYDDLVECIMPKFLRNLSLWEEGFHSCDNGNYLLVGDGEYPFKEWLLTLYRDNLSQHQTKFNMAFSWKRQVIERTFGLLKGRFRRLKFINLKSIREKCQTFVAICIFHNICIIEHDLLEDLLHEIEPDVLLKK